MAVGAELVGFLTLKVEEGTASHGMQWPLRVEKRPGIGPSAWSLQEGHSPAHAWMGARVHGTCLTS